MEMLTRPQSSEISLYCIAHEQLVQSTKSYSFPDMNLRVWGCKCVELFLCESLQYFVLRNIPSKISMQRI